MKRSLALSQKQAGSWFHESTVEADLRIKTTLLNLLEGGVLQYILI